MFAMLSSFVFTGAVVLVACAVTSTVQESRSRIADALHGRPLRRIRPMLRAAA
jgi:hypothetical protein